MYFSKVFSALLATVLATAVTASPVASSEAHGSSELAKRGPGDVYVCPQTGWGGDCAVLHIGLNTCNNIPGWQYRILSLGPDAGATCVGHSQSGCTGDSWSFTYPGDSTGGYATADPWALKIASIKCTTGGGGGGPYTYDGIATYYLPNGGIGACGGAPLGNNDLVVALGAGHWNGGSHCGETMTVS
ncbi:hypothetical protein B0H19DRAFT_1271297 [Mycena capillaripes]|nr:hypothetical protein B0H19DRAFT_1271297 [Mycena capillaripes]